MTWWCVPLRAPWEWVWRPYPGVWLLVALLAGGYLYATRGTADRGHRRFWLAGVAVLWAASDWPVGTLAAGYLASAHMAQYLLYTMAAAPLLVLGTPEWVARRLLARPRLHRAARVATRPLAAGLAFNAALFVTHAPWTVDTFRSNQVGSFALDMAWLASGLLVWLPVCGPLPELRIQSHGVKMVYLFLAAGFVAWVPASFLLFANFPLYRTFELAPRAFGLDAVTDQQAAALVMKFGGMPVVWGTIAAMWWRWAAADGPDASRRTRADAPAAVPASTAHR